MSNISFSMEPIPNAIFINMQGKTFFENPHIKREQLRYLRVLHYGFDEKVHQGQLIVHENIAEEILEIFQILYNNQYPIEKIKLMDDYNGDDNLSMEDNNSSAFNYRMIAGTDRLSKHSLGLAIDINPKYNPYIRPDENGKMLIEPEGSELYTDRSKSFLYKIDKEDLCYKLFVERGYIWGGDWDIPKDYQHFEKNLGGTA